MVSIHNNMTRGRCSNDYVKTFPNDEVGMDVVCYYRTTFGCDVESRNKRTHQQKMERPAPMTKNGKKNEIKHVWKKKTMDRHCAFKAQVISPKS